MEPQDDSEILCECPYCGGDGKIVESDDVETIVYSCPECEGSGWY